MYGEEGWQGAAYHSNNAAELTAVLKVLEHVREEAKQSEGPLEVMIAPDNLWAADVTVGACAGQAHRGLIRRARVALKLAAAAGARIKWGWTKGHSDHKWNDIADELAETGRREVGEEAASTAQSRDEGPRRRSQKRAQVLRLQQVVDASRVRRAAERGCREARRWLVKLQPSGDGMAVVEVIYSKTNPFSRRNAEGVSLQFCSRELRGEIAGEIYVEIDIKGSHPTMLREQLRRVGVSIPLLDKWVTDRAGCIAELLADCRKSGGEKAGMPTEKEVKDLVLAMLNGASAAKRVREGWGLSRTPAMLGRFERDLKHVRAQAHMWFPEIWLKMQDAKNDYTRRTRTVYFAMTVLEDEVLEAMRQRLPSLGAACDALTGDGLLARPTSEEVTPLPETLRALEAEVLAETGVEITLTAKTLSGGSAVQWHRQEPSPWERGQTGWQQPWGAWQEQTRPWESSGGWRA